MNILFIDTHSEKVNLFLERNGNLYSKSLSSQQNQNEIVMPAIKDILENANIDVNDLNEIIVVNGPGSFTGVRIGVVIAKTLAYTLNIKIKTITSLEMYAVSSSMKDCIVTIEDSKGVYSAIYDGNECEQMSYHKKSAFETYVQDINLPILQSKQIDFYKIKNYLSDKDSIEAHYVNPVYVKEIDVLK